MVKQASIYSPRFSYFAAIAATLLLFAVSTCGNSQTSETDSATGKTVVGAIQNEKEFKTIIESSGERLLVFDFYADWCAPCKQLSPLLEEIAKENRDKASFYKINIDEQKLLAQSFRVTGIPLVVFVINKTAVHTLPGLRSKDTYVKLINHFSRIAGDISSNGSTKTAGA